MSASWPGSVNSSTHHPSQTRMSSKSTSDASGADLAWMESETEFLLQKLGEDGQIESYFEGGENFYRAFANAATERFGEPATGRFTKNRARSKINSLAQVWANNLSDLASSSSFGAKATSSIRLLQKHGNLYPLFMRISAAKSSSSMQTVTKKKKEQKHFTETDLFDFMVANAPQPGPQISFYYAVALGDKTFENAALKCFQNMKRRKRKTSDIYNDMHAIFQNRPENP